MSKPTQCRTCKHRELAGINLALARGVSVRALARRYGLSRDSLYRHLNGHLPPQLRASLIVGPDLDIDLDKLRETESQSLLANLVALRGRLFLSLDVAEECRDGTMLARIAGQLHNNLELTGKLLGDLSSGHSNVTNILIAPQYVTCGSSW
jgi:transposase-like protein